MAWVLKGPGDCGGPCNPVLTGEAERSKASAQAQADSLGAVYERPSQPAGSEKKQPDSLTVEALVRAMEQVIADVPGFVPQLPLLPGLTRLWMRNDPQAITFANLPGRWGEFDRSNPDKPRIRLNNDMRTLHDKGVDSALLAHILVHELDHALLYLTGKSFKKTRHQNEVNAFVAENYYFTALSRSGRLGEVDARSDDPEKEAYYREIRKVRVKFFNGELAELIRETYGPDPSGSQRRR